MMSVATFSQGMWLEQGMWKLSQPRLWLSKGKQAQGLCIDPYFLYIRFACDFRCVMHISSKHEKCIMLEFQGRSVLFFSCRGLPCFGHNIDHFAHTMGGQWNTWEGGIGKHTSSGGDGAMQSIRKGLKNEQKKGGAVKCTRKRVTKKHTRKGWTKNRTRKVGEETHPRGGGIHKCPGGHRGGAPLKMATWFAKYAYMRLRASFEVSNFNRSIYWRERAAFQRSTFGGRLLAMM